MSKMRLITVTPNMGLHYSHGRESLTGVERDKRLHDIIEYFGNMQAFVVILTAMLDFCNDCSFYYDITSSAVAMIEMKGV